MINTKDKENRDERREQRDERREMREENKENRDVSCPEIGLHKK